MTKYQEHNFNTHKNYYHAAVQVFLSCPEVHNQFYLCMLRKESNNLTLLDFFFFFLKSIQEVVKGRKKLSFVPNICNSLSAKTQMK